MLYPGRVEPHLQPHPVLACSPPGCALLGPCSLFPAVVPLSVQQLVMVLAWLETVWMKAESPPHVPQLCGINPAPGER